jgi:N-acetylneuraminic acid mutarotase
MFSFAKLLRYCFAAVLLSFVCAGMAQAQKWVKLAPFPDASEEVYGIASGGKLYIFGGLAPGWTPKGLVYEYDPATDKWTKKKDMPVPSHHVAVTELNGKIYVMGGFTKPPSGPTAWVPIDNAWEYDPANDMWKALAPLPTKRGSPTAAVVNGKVYVIGGATTNEGSKEAGIHPARPHQVVGTNEVYDPATNTWGTRRSMPTPRNHVANGVVNGKIYVIGGRLGGAFIGRATNTDVVEGYDPATDQWSATLDRMPTPRSSLAYGTYKGKIYVAGGELQTAQMAAAFRAVEAYDPGTNSWSTLPSLEFPRHGAGGDVLGNRLHVVTGVVQASGSGGHSDVDFHHALELDTGGK